MEIRFYVNPETGEPHIYRHNVSEEEWRTCYRQAAGGLPPPEETKVKENKFPPGWDEERVRRVLAHYEEQTEAEAAAEDEAAFEDREAIREIAEDEKRQKAILAVGLRNAGRRV